MKEIIAKTIDRICGVVPGDRVLRNEPMSRHTSFRIGGPAEAFIIVNNEEELAAVLAIVTETDAKVGAAMLMSRTSAFLTENGLSGFEFASGIPGSIGGAVFMNAGAYGGEIKDVVRSVRVMDPDGTNLRTVSNEEMQFSYRHSMAEDAGILILYAEMELKKDDPEEIAARVAELQFKRNSKQPVNYPSAGSTFKRPVGGYAAALIEQSGLKGYTVGGAQVSEKHSGFVINIGDASCEDVLAVMRHVRDKVYSDSGITLEPEVRMINCSL